MAVLIGFICFWGCKVKQWQTFLCCRIGSGKQVASVIVDDGKEHDDEDDTFVVEDAHAVQNDVDVVSG